MKSKSIALIAATALFTLSSPAFAGGHGHNRGGSGMSAGVSVKNINVNSNKAVAGGGNSTVIVVQSLNSGGKTGHSGY